MAEDEEEKVFVYSIAYSDLMDAVDQSEKNTVILGESSSGSSSDPDSPGSPTPLVPDHVVEVNHNHVTLTIKHSPYFRTKMPHLAAHQMALTVGARKGRLPPYKSRIPSDTSSGRTGRPTRSGEYNLWAKHRKSSARTRRRIERPLVWLASTIVIIMMVIALLVAIFWLTGTTFTPEIYYGNTTTVNSTDSYGTMYSQTTEDWHDNSTDSSLTTTLSPRSPPSFKTTVPSTTTTTLSSPKTTTSTTTISTTTTTTPKTSTTISTTTTTTPKTSTPIVTSTPPTTTTTTTTATTTLRTTVTTPTSRSTLITTANNTLTPVPPTKTTTARTANPATTTTTTTTTNPATTTTTTTTTEKKTNAYIGASVTIDSVSSAVNSTV